MHIELDDMMKIAMVQELFNSMFPFLKIEFFEQGTRTIGNIQTRKHVSNGKRQLGEFRLKKSINPNNICISPYMKVTELETMFNNIYALQTQVFRKSGKIWLETTVTDAWSLEEQNTQGETITAQMNGSSRLWWKSFPNFWYCTTWCSWEL